MMMKVSRVCALELYCSGHANDDEGYTRKSWFMIYPLITCLVMSYALMALTYIHRQYSSHHRYVACGFKGVY